MLVDPEASRTCRRGYPQHRATLVGYLGHHNRYMRKALNRMNAKFQRVINSITGKIRIAIIEANVSSGRRLLKLAKPRDGRSITALQPRATE